MPEFGQYLRHLARHWLSLAAGVGVAALALILSAAGADGPQWLWVGIAAVFVFLASFLAYRDVARVAREKSERHERLRTSTTIEDEAVHPLDLIDRDATYPVVNGKTFRRCTIEGPAMIKLLHTPVIGCEFNFGQRSDGWFWVEEPGVPVFGVIGFVNCRFEQCRFSKYVAMSVTPAEHRMFLHEVVQLGGPQGRRRRSGSVGGAAPEGETDDPGPIQDNT